MSVHGRNKRMTTQTIRDCKSATPLVGLTAYTAPIAKIMDEHVDLILVGDSLAMTIYGLDSTLGISLDTMIQHGRAVAHSCSHACVVVDLPFGSYQESPEQAFRSASRVLQETGCQAIKLEGGQEMAETVAFLAARGVPVLGHIGLTPQSMNTLGGFKTQGRDEESAKKLLADGKAMDEAGAFATVIEGVVEPIARSVTESISIPTIGIGASQACDGQILVVDDVLGVFNEFQPKFVKRYANLRADMENAIKTFAGEVRTGAFPSEDHVFKPKA
ncbi:3-methyl-2-oxobutanoate hydroxymethyltransferase [Fodinicurvata sediminis]|uniref:3-methyl-2-oxobutanoate hydroxymethyltransferase n=1 Tax=Fodinicurvata sediminis TaxID=1121832 RepID=UPI0003B37423|nr:3-methyl-2-oxobutanoate hydroxymethyltransferase [Fodinicurvata sediminis]